MDDIVERLRSGDARERVRLEAADAIEQLRAEKKRLRAALLTLWEVLGCQLD